MAKLIAFAVLLLLACAIVGALALLWAMPAVLLYLIAITVWTITAPKRGERESAWGAE